MVVGMSTLPRAGHSALFSDSVARTHATDRCNTGAVQPNALFATDWMPRASALKWSGHGTPTVQLSNDALDLGHLSYMTNM